MLWGDGAIYFGIRCEDEPENTVNISTTESNTPNIWNGDHVEILLETDKHSYYQIVINPAGAVIGLDRAVSLGKAFRWSSKTEVGTHIGDDYWSLEVRIPVVEQTDDPLHLVVGSKPTSDLPWYFNLYRKRAGTEEAETTAFSPLGPDAGSFHVPLKFAQIYVR